MTDVSRKELSRICYSNNAHSWSLEEKGDVDEHKYYFLDRSGTGSHGDTALHRLLSLCHAPPMAILNFLHHTEAHQHAVLMRDTFSCKTMPLEYADLPDPPSMLSQNDLGCTALHVAVHRNSWQVDVVVRMILDKCPRLASVPMKCGSYPLHVATGHSATIHPAVIDALVHADPSVCSTEDCNGDTPLSLLWKNVMRFRWARDFEVAGMAPSSIDQSADMSWMTVITPDQFRDIALRLVQPFKGQPITWHTVCSTPRCPPLLIRLLLQQNYCVQGGLDEQDNLGRLPLHCAAAAAPVSLEFLPDDDVKLHAPTVLELLLRVAPSAAAVTDHSGSLALHYALRRQSALPRSSDLVALVQACPDALFVQDPVTKLYPAQQLASRLLDGESTNASSRGFDVLYCMIRSSPEVLTFHRVL